MKTRGIVLAASLLSLNACATIVSGSDETVSVTTPDVQAANCKLQNGKGEWHVTSTPGTTLVKTSTGAMLINCEKPGYENGSAVFGSNVKGWIFGNLAFGGIIGVIIDISTGAGFDYQKDMSVAMKKIDSHPVSGTVPPVTDSAAPADQQRPGPAVGS